MRSVWDVRMPQELRRGDFLPRTRARPRKQKHSIDRQTEATARTVPLPSCFRHLCARSGMKSEFCFLDACLHGIEHTSMAYIAYHSTSASLRSATMQRYLRHTYTYTSDVRQIFVHCLIQPMQCNSSSSSSSSSSSRQVRSRFTER